MLLTPGLCALVPEEMLFAHRASSFQFVCLFASFLFFWRFLFSPRVNWAQNYAYVHFILVPIAYIPRRRKKNRLLCFFLSDILCYGRHILCIRVCARVKFSSITAAAVDVAVYISLPHAFLRKIKEMSIFGDWLFEICIEFPFTPIFQITSKKKKKKETHWHGLRLKKQNRFWPFIRIYWCLKSLLWTTALLFFVCFIFTRCFKIQF